MAANSGASSSNATAEPATSMRRLSASEDRLGPTGGRLISGTPSIVWIEALGPTTSKSRGTMSTWTSSSFIAWASSRIEISG